MFGCMPIHCGYNPRTSDTLTNIQMGLAGAKGLLNIFEAKNDGANTFGAISYGLGSAAMGIGGALIGNSIDKSTHSYVGSMMSSVAMPALMNSGPYVGSSMLFASSLMSPYMMYPGFCSGFMSPMSFSNPFMFGMPRFGGFCCHC